MAESRRSGVWPPATGDRHPDERNIIMEHTSRMTPEFEARLREQQSKRDLLAQDLRQKYLKRGVPDEVAEKVFHKAWEDGHAYGEHEVEMEYDDLSEIANAAYKAGTEVSEAAFLKSLEGK